MLAVLLAVAGWCAGAVLVVSGALKLGRTERFRESLRALGLPAVLSRTPVVARAVPIGEIGLGLAVVLAPSPLHRAALLAALAAYGVFLVVAIRAWRAPEPVDCECFGGLGDARMSGRTVVRNAVLVALALAGAVGSLPPAALVAPGAPVVAAVLLALALVVVRGRRAAPVDPSTPDAPAGASPDLVLRTAAGEPIDLAEFAALRTHLVFFSPSCGSCHELVARFRWWPNGLRDGEELVPVFLGRPEDFAVHDVFAPLVEHALYDPDRSTVAALGRGSTPGHVLVDPAHPLGDGWSTGWYAIEKAVLSEEFFTEMHQGRLEPDPEVLEREAAERVPSDHRPGKP